LIFNQVDFVIRGLLPGAILTRLLEIVYGFGMLSQTFAGSAGFERRVGIIRVDRQSCYRRFLGKIKIAFLLYTTASHNAARATSLFSKPPVRFKSQDRLIQSS